MREYYEWETVLLTGTINPNTKVREWKYWHKWSISINERIIDYYISIQFYIAYSNFKNIVFCENSNYERNEQIKSLNKIAKACNKNLEIIQFEWNKNALLKTYYWYWEWEIINYALSKSKILPKCKNRYKITWRYIIENINNIIEYNKKDNNLFFRLMFSFNFHTICTALFKTNNETYNKYLYNINDKLEPQVALEELYYKVLKETDIKSWKLWEIPHRLWRDSERWKINIYHRLFFIAWCRNYKYNIFAYLFKKLIMFKRLLFKYI